MGEFMEGFTSGSRRGYRSGKNIRVSLGHRTSLKVHAAIGTARWAGKRRATRLTPFILAFGWFPGAELAMYMPVPWWILALAGTAFTGLLWLTSRQDAQHAIIDSQNNTRSAGQWAFRTATVPACLTLYLELVKEMHRRDLDVINWPMLAYYFIGSVLLWAYLFTSGHVGGARLKEQLRKTWAGQIAGTALEGSKILRSRQNRHGTEVDVDVTQTGHLTSQITSAQVKEGIAMRMGVPLERVQIKPNRKDAGKVTVQIMNGNPWEGSFAHPLHPAYGQLTPAGKPRTIMTPIPIGEDPMQQDERKRTITCQLYNNDGGQHMAVVATTGAGKSTLVNSLLEAVTAAEDADLILIDASKGIHGQAWRFACLRTHLGAEAMEAAVAELEWAAAQISVRATARRERPGRKTATFVPTAADRALVVVLDEADSVLNGTNPKLVRRAQAAVRAIVSKGRSEGVLLVLIAQRGTMKFLGDIASDVKANVSNRIVMKISQASEANWILPGWQEMGVPDMTNYGSGAPGVFVYATGNTWRTGRAYAMHEPELIEAIALDRARPDLDDAMWSYLRELAEYGEGVPALTGGWLAQYLDEHDGHLPEAGTMPPSHPGVQGQPPERHGVQRPVQGKGDLAHRSVQGAQGLHSVPAWGTPGAQDGHDPDGLFEAAREQQGRAVGATAWLAADAQRRGPVSDEALLTEQAEPGEALIPEFWPAVLDLARRGGAAGFTRATLAGALTAWLGIEAPGTRKVQRMLRTARDNGWLALAGEGRAAAWHVVPGAPGTEALPGGDAA